MNTSNHSFSLHDVRRDLDEIPDVEEYLATLWQLVNPSDDFSELCSVLVRHGYDRAAIDSILELIIDEGYGAVPPHRLDPEVRLLLSAVEELSEWLLGRLAADPRPLVRLSVAANVTTTAHVLHQLASDPDARIALVVTHHPEATLDELSMLLAHPDPNVSTSAKEHIFEVISLLGDVQTRSRRMLTGDLPRFRSYPSGASVTEGDTLPGTFRPIGA